jgi:hypothetical protein
MSTETVKKRGRKKKESVVEVSPLVESVPVIETVPLVESAPLVETVPVVVVVPTVVVAPTVEPIFSSPEPIEITIVDEKNETVYEVETKAPQKKRGRRPKGGKIIEQPIPLNVNKESKPNVILHLKCSLKDLYGTGVSNTNIEAFTFPSTKTELTYEIMGTQETAATQRDHVQQNDDSDSGTETTPTDQKEIWRKLKQLEHSLHMNNISDKKSACFWCTCEFDNPPVYIPKHHMKDSYHVYGCFCSPECATAHLMEEHIDSSAKFERYHLINHIYTKIYGYTKNIKPAPNPYYLLDKFYGNLNIQEYRALLRSERLFLVVDKPLTRILPELHEDNDDFIINNKIIPSNTYQIKKKVQRKQQTKTSILSENFGLSTLSTFEKVESNIHL